MQQPPHRSLPTDFLPQQGWPVDPSMLSSTHELVGFRIVRSIGVAHGFGHQPPAMRLGVALDHRVAESCQTAWSAAVLAMMRWSADAGANAIVGVRYELATWPDGNPVVLAFGTAVRVEPAV
jgi:uncharacterized protein YbjQ (UPF0145 family)